MRKFMTDLSSHIRSDIVTIHLASPFHQATYHVHKSLLCSVSNYFNASLNSNHAFVESRTNTITLEDIDVASFDLFTKWLYTGDLAPFPEQHFGELMYELIGVYTLGERLLCSGLRNRAVDMIQEICTDKSGEECVFDVVYCFGVKPHLLSSKLMQYLIKQLAYVVVNGKKDYETDTDFQAFLAQDGKVAAKVVFEVSKMHKAKGSKKKFLNPADEDGCTYHDHEEKGKDDGDECQRWLSEGRDGFWED
jgi:hypothetical protein